MRKVLLSDLALGLVPTVGSGLMENIDLRHVPSEGAGEGGIYLPALVSHWLSVAAREVFIS